MLNDQNTVVIKDVIPDPAWINHPIPMTFSAVCAFVDMQIKNTKASEETKRKNMKIRVPLCLAASGIGFMFTYDNEFLTSRQKIQNNTFLDALCNDDYIRYTMKFLQYEYTLIKNNKKNKAEMYQAIKDSVAQGKPLLAKKAVGRLWNIIMGYNEKTESILGYQPILDWVDAEYMVNNNPANEICENGMFHKKDWYESIEQLLVIGDKTREKICVTDFVPYWISIMEMQGTENLYCGFNAHDAFINLLKDDEFFSAADYEQLLRAYNLIQGLGGGLPECRHYTKFALRHGHFTKCFKTEIPANFKIFQKKVDKHFANTHNQCWNVWRTSGFEPDVKKENVEAFRTWEVREKVLQIFEIIKNNDLVVYEALKKHLVF
ncbi:MAG: hypothetical protein FWC32_10925 [Firmicutes bacterium]|nr:hypothetical protein [Bacillota bacterium]